MDKRFGDSVKMWAAFFGTSQLQVEPFLQPTEEPNPLFLVDPTQPFVLPALLYGDIAWRQSELKTYVGPYLGIPYIFQALDFLQHFAD